MSGSDSAIAHAPAGRWPLIRWFTASGTLNMPQAAGPVAFSLVALALTGDASRGAAIMVAMTVAQILGAIPITRWGRKFPTTTYLRWLIVFRTVALAAIAILAAYGASLAWLIAFAALAGSVNGAAFGYMRSLLNALTPAEKMPRALGIASTLNEITFVLAPVIASGLGIISPVFAVLAVAVLGALPALLLPNVGSAHLPDAPNPTGAVITPAIALWLGCAAAGGATVAAVEIGAVSLALSYGYPPTSAILFTVPLCLASVAGGIWVSWRNRRASPAVVVLQLAVMALGTALTALEISVLVTVTGAVLIGFVLAPLSTHYSLVLDALAPAHRKAEVFALMRTANAVGVITAGTSLTVLSLTTALAIVAGLILMATLAIAAGYRTRRLLPSQRNIS